MADQEIPSRRARDAMGGVISDDQFAARPEQAGGPGATVDAPSQYDENGVDLSLIRSNMRLTPEERARRAERARKAALRVQQIGRDSRRKPA